jgi:hypothetical protein
MRNLTMAAVAAALLLPAASAAAASISGEYLEARTCDVYTGPCFANAEMDQNGKEAVMAWKIEKGTWNKVKLDGLTVALVVNAQGTLGDDGVFPMRAGKIRSVILVDEKADTTQHSAKKFTKNVVKVQQVPMSLKNDHLDGKGVFTAGKIAKIETRKLKQGDCVCTNEIVYYQPLTKVQNFSPAYSQTLSFQGTALNNRWTTRNIRSAFLATFRK